MSALGSPSDALSRAIVETVRTPLLVLDAECRVVSANPVFASTFGFAPEDLIGLSLFEIGGGRWNLPELRSLLERVLPEREEVRDVEIRADLGETGRRYLRLNARQVVLEGKKKRLILVAVDDVTEQHHSQARIDRYARELERSNRDLEGFAHAASHDLQEPLRKISMYVGRLLEHVDVTSADERTRRYLARLPEAVSRMQTRIDDLLQLARIGRGESTRVPTDLGGVVSAVLDDLEVRLTETGGDVDVGELPTVYADPAQMRLLFQNLLANGLKFHGESRTPRIRVRTLPPPEDAADPTWTIVVEDDGIGFDPQYAERIFDPFMRLHGRDAYDGSGVGLAICRRIAEEHGGSVTAEGRPGVGARFVLNLPGVPPSEARP